MRVLRILTRANIGGPMHQALALHEHDADAGLQTLIAVGACGVGETEMDLSGTPVLDATEVHAESRGLIRLARMGRAARPWRDVLAVTELRRVIRRFQPDVVHTHTSQAGFFGRRAAVAEGVPVVAHTFHGHVLADYYSRPVNLLFRHLEARAARTTDVLLAVSASCRDELHGFGIGEGRIEVIPPAVDLARFEQTRREDARGALGLRDGDFAVGLVGRLVPVKQPGVFADVIEQLGDVRGFVFGGGPLQGELVGRPGLELRGATPDMHNYFAALDALVLCSLREGCPLVALEAFAAGVPLVGFDAPGIHDVLSHWGTGLSVPVEAGVPGLLDALSRLRDETSLAERLVAEAKTGLDRFHPGAVAARLAAHYATAASRKTVPATGT